MGRNHNSKYSPSFPSALLILSSSLVCLIRVSNKASRFEDQDMFGSVNRSSQRLLLSHTLAQARGKVGQWDNGTRRSRVLALTCMAKVRQWLSSGPGLSSDVQPNSIRTLSSALHLGCGAKQWMPV